MREKSEREKRKARQDRASGEQRFGKIIGQSNSFHPTIPPQEINNLSEEKICECREVFKLFDRDQDGVLSLHELGVVMKTLGFRLTGVCVCVCSCVQ